MKIAITGATGFVGRHVVKLLTRSGHQCRCWYREESDRGGFSERHEDNIEWIPGELGDELAARMLVEHADALVHAAIDWPRPGWRGNEHELIGFASKNLSATLDLLGAARDAEVGRVVCMSSTAACAARLSNVALNEHHPAIPANLYGAHKASIEKFVQAMGLANEWQVSALRCSGIYGINRPVEASRWFRLIRDVLHDKPIRSPIAGRVVHVKDVAHAIGGLIVGDHDMVGKVFNCCDLHVSDQQVAAIAARKIGSVSRIERFRHRKPDPFDTRRLRALGMTFGGKERLVKTIEELIDAARTAEHRPFESPPENTESGFLAA